MKSSFHFLIIFFLCLLGSVSDAYTRMQKISDPGSACSKSVLGQHPTPEAIIRCLFAPEVIESHLFIGSGGFEFYYFTTRSLRHELDREIACTIKWNGLCSFDYNTTLWTNDRDQVSVVSISFDGVHSAMVDFSNFGKPNRSVYRFTYERGDWLIDNIEHQNQNAEGQWITDYDLRRVLIEGRQSEAKWSTKAR